MRVSLTLLTQLFAGVLAVPAVDLVEKAPPACVQTLRSPPPPLFHCGDQGTLKPSLIAKIGSSINTLTNDICRERCFATPNCKTWSFNTATTKCTIYFKTLDQQGFTPSANGIVNYNRKCYTCAAPVCANRPNRPLQAICGSTCCLPREDCVNTACQASTGWRGPCGTPFCGQTYQADGTYQAQYIAECDSNYAISTAYQTLDATDIFNCIEQCDNDYCCHTISFDRTSTTQNCFFFYKAGNPDSSCTNDPNGDPPPLSNDQIFSSTQYDSAIAAGYHEDSNYRGYGVNYDTISCPATSPRRSPSCDTDMQADHGLNQCSYAPHCAAQWVGTPVATFTSSNFNGCLDACDKSQICYYMHFNAQTLACEFFEDVVGNSPVPSLAYDAVEYVSGSC